MRWLNSTYVILFWKTFQNSRFLAPHNSTLNMNNEIPTPTTPLGSEISFPNTTGDEIEARLMAIKGSLLIVNPKYQKNWLWSNPWLWYHVSLFEIIIDPFRCSKKLLEVAHCIACSCFKNPLWCNKIYFLGSLRSASGESLKNELVKKLILFFLMYFCCTLPGKQSPSQASSIIFECPLKKNLCLVQVKLTFSEPLCQPDYNETSGSKLLELLYNRAFLRK